MKICFVTNISSGEVFGLDFVNYFSKQDDVSVVTLNGFDIKNISPFVKNIYSIDFNSYPSVKRKILFFKAVKELKGLLDEISPDIVLSLNAGSHAGMVIQSGFHPFMLIPFGSDISFRSYLFNLNNLLCRYIVGKSDFVLAQDKVMRERLLQLGVKPSSIVVCHWGVDTGFYHPEFRDKRFDVVNIHGYNTIHYRYIDIYLKALSILKDRGINLRALLVGNTGFFDNVIDDLGLTGSLIQKSFLSQKDLREVFWESHLMVDAMYPPFHDGCGYGIGVVQAMGCGTPVLLADRRCVCLDGVDKWFYGGVFRHCDADDLADWIEDFLKDEKQLELISKTNRLSVEKNFDRDRNMGFLHREICERILKI